MTSTAKIPEALPVDTPSSTVQTKLPETDLATLTVGRVFWPERKRNSFENLRVDVREIWCYFTDEDKRHFHWWMILPMLNLKQIIEMDAADRSKAGQPGVPAFAW
jgi:hypothetical protein